MTAPLTAAEIAGIERSLAVGTHREPPPVPPRLARGDAPEITALAFLAHQRRLTSLPPRCPTTVQWIEAPEDARPVLPEALRPGWRRLVAVARASRQPRLLRPAAAALRDRGLRLHPFDVPDVARLEDIGPCVGAFERWAGVLAVTEIDADLAALSQEEWVELGPVARASWLRLRRTRDAAAARAVLEGVWSSERAEVRVALLDALRVGLSADDRPFLDGLRGDRSSKVKALAAELRLTLDATPEVVDGEQGLAVVVAALSLARVLGVGPRRLAVAPGQLETVQRELAWLDPLEVAAAVGVPVDDLARGKGEAVALLPALRTGAVRFARVDFLRTSLAHALPAAGFDLGWLEPVTDLGAADCARVLEAALSEAVFHHLDHNPTELASLVAVLDGVPLVPGASARLRATRPWAAMLESLDDDKTAAADLARLAPLIHPDDAAAALAQVAAAHPGAAPAVQELWRFLAALSTHPSSDDPGA